jgi:hypothetical protein
LVMEERRSYRTLRLYAQSIITETHILCGVTISLPE